MINAIGGTVKKYDEQMFSYLSIWIYRQSSVKTNQLENIPSNNTFHILPFTYVTHDNPG